MVTGLIYVKSREDSERLARMFDTKFKQPTVPLLEKQIGDVKLDDVNDNAERESLDKMMQEIAG
eukprot:12409597-Karenia_brevis.AAC.1